MADDEKPRGPLPENRGEEQTKVNERAQRVKERAQRRYTETKAYWASIWGYFFPGDLFLLASGADPTWFKNEANDSEEERRRFRTQGAIVCLTATFATLGALYFFSFVFDETVVFIGPNLLTVLFALVWGGMIFCLDKLMLQTMLGEEGRKWRPAVARMLLAILIGLVIAHPLKLQVFKPTLEAKYDAERQTFFLNSARTAKAAREALRRELTPDGASQEDINKYVLIDQFLQRSEPVIDRSRDYVILESEGVGTRDLGRPAQIELPLSNFQLDVVLSRSPGCSSTNWSEIGQLNRFETEYRNAEIALDRAYPFGDPDKREAARNITAEILRQIPEVTKYRLGSQNVNDDGVENCALFQWVLDQWVSATEQARNDQIDLAIRPDVVAELETNLAEFNDLSRASRRLSICAEPMQGYTLADQRSDEARIAEEGINPSIYFDGIFSVDPDSPNARRDIPGKEWTPYLCTSRYPDFSFIWQTDLLFRLGEGPSDGAKLSEFGKNLASIGISLLFVVMEILPVLSKLFTRPGPYELDVARRVRIARANFDKDPTKKNPKEEAEEQEAATVAKFKNQNTENVALAYLALDRRIKQKKAELLLNTDPPTRVSGKIKKLDDEMKVFVDAMDPRIKKLLFD
ncbi:MAG: DUF4407 domain-containing protein [Rhizobiaceae bacterium]